MGTPRYKVWVQREDEIIDPDPFSNIVYVDYDLALKSAASYAKNYTGITAAVIAREGVIPKAKLPDQGFIYGWKENKDE